RRGADGRPGGRDGGLEAVAPVADVGRMDRDRPGAAAEDEYGNRGAVPGIHVAPREGSGGVGALDLLRVHLLFLPRPVAELPRPVPETGDPVLDIRRADPAAVPGAPDEARRDDHREGQRDLCRPHFAPPFGWTRACRPRDGAGYW